jgi:hypothetical protein
MRKQHKALAVVAVHPDLNALMVSPNPSVALQAPVCCGSRTLQVLVKRYQRRKPAVIDALQASLLQGELGVLCITTLSLVLAFSLISTRSTRCEATDFLTNSHCREVQVVTFGLRAVTCLLVQYVLPVVIQMGL